MPPAAGEIASFRRARAGRPCSNHALETGIRSRPWDAAALGHRLAVELLDVGREGDGRRGADRHADPIRMNGALRRLELADALGVEAARDEDADVLETREVEARAHLFHEVDGDATPLVGRVEPHPAKARAQGRGDAGRLFGL